jgi:hypothetical protein
MMKSSTLGLRYDGFIDLDINAVEQFLDALTTDDGKLDKQLAGKIFLCQLRRRAIAFPALAE